MAGKIYKYEPVVTSGPNGTDYRPRLISNNINELNSNIIDLCFYEGFRYVSIPTEVQFEVPEEISQSWIEVVLNEASSEALKKECFIVKIINDRLIEKIRKKYSLNDELYYARITSGSLLGTYIMANDEEQMIAQYQVDIENYRAQAKAERIELGFIN